MNQRGGDSTGPDTVLDSLRSTLTRCGTPGPARSTRSAAGNAARPAESQPDGRPITDIRDKVNNVESSRNNRRVGSKRLYLKSSSLRRSVWSTFFEVFMICWSPSFTVNLKEDQT